MLFNGLRKEFFTAFSLVVLISSVVFSQGASAQIIGDQPPANEEWTIGNNTQILGETLNLTGNVTVDENVTLTIQDSTVVFDKDLTIATNASLIVSNSTLEFQGNYTFFFSYGDVDADNSTFLTPNDTSWSIVVFEGDFNAIDSAFRVGWEMNFALTANARLERCGVSFANNSWIAGGAMLIESQDAILKDVSFVGEEGQQYTVNTFFPSNVEFNGCTFTNGGISSNTTATIIYMPDTTLNSNAEELLLEGCTFTGSIGADISIDTGIARIFNTTLSDSLYSISSHFSLIEVAGCTITNTSAALILWSSAGSDLAAPASSLDQLCYIHNNTFTDNDVGIFLSDSVARLENNTLGGNSEYGIYGWDSRMLEDTSSSNDFLSPTHNTNGSIMFVNYVQALIHRTGSIPVGGARVYIPETNWTSLADSSGHLYLNGSTGLIAYSLANDGTETYGKYTVNTSWNTGVYVSYDEFVIEPLNLTNPSSPILISLDAGPELEINFIEPSVNVVPSGGTLSVSVNVTNHWWYTAENVTITVTSDFDTAEVTVSIPANTTIEEALVVSVADRPTDGTVTLTAWVDPSREFEGQYLDRTNNVEETTINTIAEPNDAIPITGLLVAIGVLLVVFVFSMYRALYSKKDDNDEDKDNEKENTEGEGPSDESGEADAEETVEKSSFEKVTSPEETPVPPPVDESPTIKPLPVEDSSLPEEGGVPPSID